VIPQTVESGVDHEMVAAVREYVADKVIPVAGQLEREHQFPLGMLADLGKMGLLGMNVPEQCGGLALGLVTRSSILRELAYGWMSLAGIISSHSVAAGVIASFGTEEQRARWLPALASGSALACISLSEPQAGSDLRSIVCRATRTATGFRINGLKTYVTNGSQADIVVLLAKTEDDKLSCFIVGDVKQAREKGTISVSTPFDKLGNRGSEVVEMVYDDHEIPADALLGGENGLGRGLHAALSQLDIGRINIANIATGLAMAAFDAAQRYAAERTAFGQSVDSFQGIEFKLAEMATSLYACRVLADDVAARYDAGEPVGMEAAMAKYFCSEASLQITLDAVRIHGGAGYVADFPVERFFRDAPLMAIGEGTNEILKVVIFRALKDRQSTPSH
jgi:alkylation response protein AidB-like acyl-CoA dehydrogenase